MRRGISDDKHDRRSEMRFIDNRADAIEGRIDAPLVGQADAAEHRNGRGRRFARRDEGARPMLSRGYAHVKDQRARKFGESTVVERWTAFFGVFLPGDKGDRRCGVPMRHWNSGIAGRGKRRRDPRDDLKFNLVLNQAVQLLASAGKHHWIAALEPNHRRIDLGHANQPLVNLRLLQDASTAVLAQRDQSSSGAAVAKDLRIDEIVIEHSIGALQNFHCAERNQARIARPGADEINFTLCHLLQNNSMSDSPPRSLLITPDLRRRLQQRYDEAQRLATQSPPDVRRIHDLLAECLRADPGSILYLNALLANLRRREASEGQSWWQRIWSRASRADRSSQLPEANRFMQQNGAGLSTDYAVLQSAPDLLWRRPLDTDLYKRLAAAAAASDFDLVELRYLQSVLERSPDDLTTRQSLARALTRQGRFEHAMEAWSAVLARQPNDNEAQQAMADLRGLHPAATQAASDPDEPSDAEGLLERARLLLDAGEFLAAEACLAKAQAALGGDLNVLMQREELRILHSAQRVQIAKDRASHDPHPKAQRLVERFANEQNRLETEILNARVERLPANVGIRVELARKLKQGGNFSGAIQRLEEALRLKPDEAAAYLELGECWQHLRQFSKALELYEHIARIAGNTADEIGKLAHYRAAVLAAALGRSDEARNHFRLVLAADPAYRDARERLDKLGPN